MMIFRMLVILVNIVIINSLYGQSDTLFYDSDFMIGFYNVENLFHPSDDSLKKDEDFTPTGLYHWSYKKYYRKISNVAKVFIAMGEGFPPILIGLAEIENERVLKDLCYRSPLKKFEYAYVHYDSPDHRGIDVALLYRKPYLQIINEHPIHIEFPFEPGLSNRDILYAKVQINHGQFLHLFVNHWTSRYGGYAATIPKRNYYAQVVKQHIDSILYTDIHANILVMGDFNDYATDASLRDVLRACPGTSEPLKDTLYNLMYRFEMSAKNVGSHKHEDFWGCLDQIIVSRGLLNCESGLEIVGGEAHVFDAPFLLVPDEKYGGWKTYRTFLGPRYIGGYSDHLPVYVRCRRAGIIAPKRHPQLRWP